MHEFEFISSLLAPLAAGKTDALGLTDDAALIKVPPGYELVVTKDAIVEGVHFIGNEGPALIARKALRVNLSDLAAMGAVPYGYFLALMLPKRTNEAWLRSFVQGLRTDQENFKFTLLGGDTTLTAGPLCLSVTALGLVPGGQALRRNGAKPGDGIYVSGTVGDSALGLSVERKTLQTNHNAYFSDRYHLPRPRVVLGEALRMVATSCIDISDGLLQELEHIATQSNVAATIRYNDIPLSDEAHEACATIKDAQKIILSGGDDYELLFTVPEGAEKKLSILAETTDTKITKIGEINTGNGVRALDEWQKEITLAVRGYRHF